jgi:N-acetylmuramic acid 6-phosphate etherase
VRYKIFFSEHPDSTNVLEEIINREDAKIASAVRLCLPEVARIIDLMAPKVLKGGRVIYIGAGTSGR